MNKLRNIMLLLAVVSSFLNGIMGSYDPYLDMAEMNRLQLLDGALQDYLGGSQMLNGRNIEDGSYWPELAALTDGKTEFYDPPLYSGAHPRDQELIEHSDLHGFQSVSGGTAEGEAKNKQVKTDKPLPAYCNPPNPCPVGKGAKENCVENFENTAENNQRLQSEQDCPCDTEHMYSCPAGSKTVSTKSHVTSQQMAALNGENNPYLSTSNKRLTLVAKKSPHAITKRSEIYDHGNPYLQGEHMDIAAKKDPNLAKSSMYHWKLP